MLLIIKDKEKMCYIAVTKLSPLLRGEHQNVMMMFVF